MSDDLVTHTPSQLSIPQMMGMALAPFRLSDQLAGAFEIAHGARSLVKAENGKLVALQQAKTKEARFSLHCAAYNAVSELPSKTVIVNSWLSIKKAIDTKPSEHDLGLLLGKFLDVLQIKPGPQIDDYVETLAWKLMECPKQSSESRASKRRPWMPIPAIAAAVNKFWETYEVQFGKPPSIPDVLRECGRHSDNLICLFEEIHELGLTQGRLVKLVAATDDSYPDGDDWA
jgi:hypothetical protein